MPFTTKRQMGFRKDRTKYGKRHKPGVMNTTEGLYAEILAMRMRDGEILGWDFESITFKIADESRYTPDFAVYLADGTIEFVDVKGGGPISPESLGKIKACAEKFWQYQFVLEQKLSRKDAAEYGKPWKRREF